MHQLKRLQAEKPCNKISKYHNRLEKPNLDASIDKNRWGGLYADVMKYHVEVSIQRLLLKRETENGFYSFLKLNRQTYSRSLSNNLPHNLIKNAIL